MAKIAQLCEKVHWNCHFIAWKCANECAKVSPMIFWVRIYHLWYFHTLICTLSCNKIAILMHFFTQLRYFSHLWPILNIFSLWNCLHEMPNIFEIPSHTLFDSFTDINTIKISFYNVSHVDNFCEFFSFSSLKHNWPSK